MALGLAPVRLATLPMCMTEGGEVAKRCGQYRVDASTQPTTRGQNMVQSEPLSPPFSAATPPEQTPLWHRFRLFIDQSKNEPDPYFSTSTCPAKRSTAPRSCGSTTTALVTPATSTAGRSSSDPRDQSSPSRDPGLGRGFFYWFCTEVRGRRLRAARPRRGAAGRVFAAARLAVRAGLAGVMGCGGGARSRTPSGEVSSPDSACCTPLPVSTIRGMSNATKWKIGRGPRSRSTPSGVVSRNRRNFRHSTSARRRKTTFGSLALRISA